MNPAYPEWRGQNQAQVALFCVQA